LSDATSFFKISFEKARAEILVTSAQARSLTLMQILLNSGTPVASSCQGDGVCAKCRVQVIQGHENLSAPSPTEIFLRDRHSLESDERVSCQVHLLGDITVDTPYW